MKYATATLILMFATLHGPLFAADGIQVDSDVLSAQQQRIETMKRAAKATISIFGLDGGGGGSGVIVTPDGYALTNYHVSSACGDHMRCGLNDGKLYDAVIVGVDAVGDLSLIKLLGRDDFPTAPLADSDAVRVGQWCFAAGNPFVLASNLQPTVSLGLVSGVHRYQYPAGTLLEYADCIQTDAAINPGNSGGPLFNLAGEIIGINGRCSFEKRGRVNVGVGYAISSNQVKHFMGVLKSGRLIDHATLGATVSTNDAGEVVVSNIVNTSDAYRRGLRYGDEVVSLADRDVPTTNVFKNILGTLPRAWRVPLVVRRNGETRTMLVRLEGVHTEKQLIELVSPEKKPTMVPEAPESSDTEEGTPDQDADDAELQPGVPNKALVDSLLELRPGFSNYHFNLQWRERLWGQIRERADLDGQVGEWSLSGKLGGESTQVKIELNADDATLAMGSREIKLAFEDSMSDAIATRREKGLLVGLRAYRELLTVGPEQLGATTYFGTYPVYRTRSMVLSEQPRMHMLRTLWYDAEVRTYIEPESGLVAFMEVFGDAADDPVELYFENYIDTEFGKERAELPSRVRLQYGTEPLLLIEIEKATLVLDEASQQNSDEETDS